ncbi:TetR/AcrR family transcriptional regulator [Streptosporangium lutulentum]
MASTRVADIAKATNVSGGLIHYHFATKDDLITAMLRSTSESEIQRLREIVAEPGTAVERLDRVLLFYIPASRSDQSWILWLDAWAVGVREAHVRAILLELEGTWIEILGEVIAEGWPRASSSATTPRGRPSGSTACWTVWWSATPCTPETCPGPAFCTTPGSPPPARSDWTSRPFPPRPRCQAGNAARRKASRAAASST